MTTLPAVTVAVLFALALEVTLGEPPSRVHPVALFGGVVDRLANPDVSAPRLVGAILAVGLPLAAALLVYVLMWLTILVLPVVATAILASVVLWITTSLRLLLEAAEEVIEHSDDDIEAARDALPALVGRDTAELSPELVRSAAVESLAENLSDGLVAPMLAFGVFAVISLPAAAAAAAFLKAVNTMDSILGYPGAFGWGSARLDDLMMFVPARVTAVLLGFVGGDPDAPLRARRYARVPASPNAGWPMGALAAALNVRLEKPGAYVLNDVADLPTVEDGRAALAATRRAGFATYGLLAFVGMILWL